MKTISKLVGASVAIAVLLTGPAVSASAVALGSTNHTATVNGTVVSTQTAITTQAQLTAFETSDAKKVITIDPTTNAVVSVTQVSAQVLPAAISNPCASGALCWQAAKVPYANYGFAGVGTYSGTWSWRGNMLSHNWGGQLRYTLDSSSVVWTTTSFGHNSEIDFTGSHDVIGRTVYVFA